LAEGQRIEALDVVRGFALLGIFLMNIEWFNRPIAAFNEGMPRGLTGLDWLASWFIAYFVQGKFWTIFSLLFGMGFAVMLVRAERAGREFTKVYLRRILALAVFGAVHFIYLWEGDILFSYAVGALALLIVLYGRARPILIAGALLVGLGFIPDADLFFRVAGGLAATGLLALYLRGTKLLAWRGLSMPVFCVLLLVAGVVLSIVAAVVVGGVNIFGGSGSLAGAAIGALFLGFIANALILVGLSQFWLQAIYGVVILGAVSADALILRRVQRATIEQRAR